MVIIVTAYTMASTSKGAFRLWKACWKRCL